MTGHEMDDELIRDMFARRADRGDLAGMSSAIAHQTAAIPQRRPVPARTVVPLRLLAVAAILGTTGAIGVAVSGGLPRLGRTDTTPGPSSFASPVPSPAASPASSPVASPIASAGIETVDYVRPFTYPAELDARLPGFRRTPTMVYFESIASPDSSASPEGEWGVTIATTRGAVVARCPDNLPVSPVLEEPASFLDGLETVGGVAVGSPREVTFDGRPALVAQVDAGLNRCDGAEYRIQDADFGSGSTLRLDVPSRLTLTEIDGLTIVLQLWAATPQALEDVRADGEALLAQFHFTGNGQPVASPTPVSFARTFTYQPAPGGNLLPPQHAGPTVTFNGRDGPEGDWGIVLSPVRGAEVHNCKGRTGGYVPVRDAPLDFLADLDDRAGVVARPSLATTFDGRPAVVTTVDPSTNRCEYADLHPAGSGVGVGGYVELDVPLRMTLVDVDGATILISIWADTSERLGEILPEADAFLDGLQFTGGGTAP